MIKLFRWLRQKQLSNGSVQRYGIYALGEILLVVIGILLALQINNWSEDQKNQRYEQYLLGELLANVREDGEQIALILDKRYLAAEGFRMMQSMENGVHSPDSVGKAAGYILTFERFFPIRTAYEVAKSNGLPISDRALRSQVARYYEYEQQKVGQSIQDIEDVMIPELRFGSENFIMRRLPNVAFTFEDPTEPRVYTWMEKVVRTNEPNLSASLEKIETFQDINQELQAVLEAALP